MKQTLVNTLEYPKVLLKEYLQMDSCPHSYFYNRHDANCQMCFAKPECEWLYKHDTTGELHDKSNRQLLNDLEFALLSIQGHIARWEHNSHYCECEACEWLKNAQRLYDLNKPVPITNYREKPA